MYKKFEDLEFNQHPLGGVVARTIFENGFGISVVQSSHTYGGNEGLYEIAVLDNNGHITYSTPVADDVIGYLNEEEVSDIMIQIQDLVLITDNSFANK